jgi:cyclic pyranopterin phosphate synthase
LQNNKNEHYLSFNAILKEIIEVFPHTETISDQRSKSSAVYFNVPGYKGNFAIIPAFSRTLCGTCNRLRLTAIGEIKTCLYADSMLNIRDIMRAGVSDKELLSELASAVKQKHSNGFEAEAARNQKVIHESMVSIGG